jgi:hypothetical protein
MKKLFACLAFAVVGAQAQGIHPNDLSKAPPEVVDQAAKDASQDLNVILEPGVSYKRAGERRRERGLIYSDRQLSDETAAEIDVLKAGVFPNGRLGEAVVLDNPREAALLLVRVPNLNALTLILAHPRVRAVEPNRVYVGGPANTPVISERSESKALAAEIDTAKRSKPND